MGDEEEKEKAYVPTYATSVLLAAAYTVAAILLILSISHAGTDGEAACRKGVCDVWPQAKFGQQKDPWPGVAWATQLAAILLLVILAANGFSHSWKDKVGKEVLGDDNDRWHHSHPNLGCSGSPALYSGLQIALGILVGLLITSEGQLVTGGQVKAGFYYVIGACVAITAGMLLEHCVYRRTNNGRKLGKKWEREESESQGLRGIFQWMSPSKPKSKDEEKAEEKKDDDEEESEKPKKKTKDMTPEEKEKHEIEKFKKLIEENWKINDGQMHWNKDSLDAAKKAKKEKDEKEAKEKAIKEEEARVAELWKKYQENLKKEEAEAARIQDLEKMRKAHDPLQPEYGRWPYHPVGGPWQQAQWPTAQPQAAAYAPPAPAHNGRDYRICVHGDVHQHCSQCRHYSYVYGRQQRARQQGWSI